MFSKYLKNISILNKFLVINAIIFTIIGLFTFIYLNNIQPSLLKKKSQNHTEIINNTIDNILRLDVKFQSDDNIVPIRLRKTLLNDSAALKLPTAFPQFESLLKPLENREVPKSIENPPIHLKAFENPGGSGSGSFLAAQQ